MPIFKTTGGWMLGGGPGRWTWIAPAKLPSAGAVARTRKAAAKAKGRRDTPMQD